MTATGNLAGVVSVLDDVHSERVRSLWEMLEAEFGLRAVSVSPIPHITYQVARDYDLDALRKIVEGMAGGARAVRVRTAGLGVFPGPHPTIYVPVVRSPELTKFQLAIWSAGSLASEDPGGDYHPANWVPHITLAQGDVSAETLPGVVARLNEESLMWDLELDNLSIIEARGNEPQEVSLRCDLLGAARNF